MRRQADWFRQAERKLASAQWDITQYPNGFPAGAPIEFYDLATAEEAVDLAESVLGYVRAQL
jgi:HEPN domain-containing protein